MKCRGCFEEVDESASRCSHCGYVIDRDEWSESNLPSKEELFGKTRSQSYEYEQQYPMKWYKFLIYFYLIFNAVVNAVNGFQLILGKHYQSLSVYVYQMIPSLKVIDKIYGILLIAMACFFILIHYKLRKYSKDGPRYLSYLFIYFCHDSSNHL